MQTAQDEPVVTSASDLLETFRVLMHHHYSQYVQNTLLGIQPEMPRDQFSIDWQIDVIKYYS